MRIEISEKGSDAFCREVVNITAQYRSILKNHNHKLKDYFRQFRLLLVLGAAVLVILILMAVSGALIRLIMRSSRLSS